MDGEQTGSLIVVGVDGSEPSKEALRWAARQAELTGATLRVVRAWQLPSMYGFPADLGDADFEGDARRDLDETVREVLGSGARVSTHVAEGDATSVLLEAAEGADLLVVGSRGHGALAGMLLGSVSSHCVHHAKGTVVVVREPH